MEKTPGLRERKKKNTRRLILKSANALFHERGFAAATLDEIAENAGVHKQTVLRYFGSKEGIAVAFRQVALEKFKKGLLEPARIVPVLDYWRAFIEASAREVAERGDALRFNKLVETEPALMAASFGIHMQYEELLATELSREAGIDPEGDLYARLLAGFLVSGNLAVVRHVLRNGELRDYARQALAVVDFAIDHFPPRACLNVAGRTLRSKPATR